MSHFVSASCEGEPCGFVSGLDEHSIPNVPKRCGRPSTHKVEEAIMWDDPQVVRHPFTQYLCCEHYSAIMGPASGCGIFLSPQEKSQKSEERRVLSVSLVYNWETREKSFSIEETPIQKELKPGDHLYRAQFEVWKPQDGVCFMELCHSTEEWDTQSVKPDNMSVEAYVARMIFGRLSRFVPPHSFGPGASLSASNLPGEHHTSFSLNKTGEHFVILVCKVPKEKE